MNTITSNNRSLLNFSLLEFVLSIPFWVWVALAHARVVPDLQMLNAAWSLTPMMAALILVYRENKTAGMKELFKRCFDQHTRPFVGNRSNKGCYHIKLLLTGWIG